MRTLKLAGAVAGLGALAACSANLQGAAVFIEDERISEETVDGYVDEFADLAVEQGGTLADVDYGGNREQIVVWIVLSEIGQRLDLPEADTSGATGEVHAIYLEANDYFLAIYEAAEPRELDAEELAVLAEAGQPFESLRPADQESLMRMAGTADALEGYIDDFDVKVNPRYGLETFNVAGDQLPGLFEVEIPRR